MDLSFVTVTETSPDSQQTDLTLKQWVRETSADERKKFFDTFFGLFLDAGITSINDLRNLKNFSKIKEIFQNAQDLDPTEREMLERLAKQLLDTRVQAWKNGRPFPVSWFKWLHFSREKKPSRPPYHCFLSIKSEGQLLKRTTSSIH